MSISELSVRRPVLMTMIYLLIMLIALVFVSGIEQELYPSVDMPLMSIIVSCDGYGPEEIEQQVAKPLEDALYSIEGLDTMTTSAQSDRLMIRLEFDYGTDLDEAEDTVNTYVSMLTRSLPDWAGTPSVIRMDSIGSTQSIIELSLTGDRTLEELKDLADDTVSPLLERVSGVAQVNVRGGSTTEYEVNVDPERLFAYGMTIAEVSSALADHNSEQYIGTVQQGDYNYQISTDSRYYSVSEIEDTVIRNDGATLVRVSDVAEVKLSDESTSRSFIDGNEVINISVSNESDSNATTVANDIIAALPDIQSELPNGVSLRLRRNSTEMISSTMRETYKSAIEGVIFAALVIFLFLRNFKATITIALSMPICILITILCMSLFGISINAMSMAGLILGIGMIVDASVIILENTYSYRQKGYKSAVAAILGSKNMVAAILASTLTTICVFLPMVIYKYELGMIGIMFQDMIITICIALLSSLFVSITLVPALCGSILRLNTRLQKPLRFGFMIGIDNLFIAFEEGLRIVYVKALNWVLDHKGLFILLMILLLIFFCFSFSDLGFRLMPNMSTNDTVSMSLTMPEGTVKEITLQKLFEMEQNVREILPENSYKSITVNLSSSSNSGTIRIDLPDITEQELTASQVQNKLRPFIAADPIATWAFSAGRGISTNAVDVSISSDDPDLIENVADQIVNIFSTETSALIDISSDVANGSPEMEIVVDYDMAKQLGVSISSLQYALYYAISGYEATDITTFDTSKTYTVVVSVEDYIDTLASMESLMVSGSAGLVRLDQIATFSYGTAPKSITREDRVRINHVTADAADGVSSDEAEEIARKLLDQYLFVPEGVEVSIGGEMADFGDYMVTMVKVILLALALVYMVMAAQFESLVDPFIIFATIPLLMIGVIGIHMIMGQSFSLFSIVGIVALIGVVVNNGIVLIDAINRYVKAKIKVRDACILAAKNRLRPILMTTLTTIIGMVPMAFFPGEGTEMIQPIALTFFGGIITGAFLTLFLSPTLYCVFHRRIEKKYDDPQSLNNQLLEFDQWRATHIESEEMKIDKDGNIITEKGGGDDTRPDGSNLLL